MYRIKWEKSKPVSREQTFDEMLDTFIRINAALRDALRHQFKTTGIYTNYKSTDGVIYARHFPIGSDELEDMARSFDKEKAHSKKDRATAEDFASVFEEPITILEDLMLIAIEEIGNGSGRTLSVLLPAIRYVHDLKAINRLLLDTECVG
jgi:hypothetical protein